MLYEIYRNQDCAPKHLYASQLKENVRRETAEKEKYLPYWVLLANNIVKFKIKMRE